MPSRNRSREAAKARRQAELEAQGLDSSKQKKKPKAGARSKKRPKSATSKPDGRRRPAKDGPMLDPSADDNADVRFVIPGDAVKVYLCPGCNRDIVPGVGHIVAVPPDAPDLRRHWHRGCWEHRDRRF